MYMHLACECSIFVTVGEETGKIGISSGKW